LQLSSLIALGSEGSSDAGMKTPPLVECVGPISARMPRVKKNAPPICVSAARAVAERSVGWCSSKEKPFQRLASISWLSWNLAGRAVTALPCHGAGGAILAPQPGRIDGTHWGWAIL